LIPKDRSQVPIPTAAAAAGKTAGKGQANGTASSDPAVLAEVWPLPKREQLEFFKGFYLEAKALTVLLV